MICCNSKEKGVQVGIGKYLNLVQKNNWKLREGITTGWSPKEDTNLEGLGPSKVL